MPNKSLIERLAEHSDQSEGIVDLSCAIASSHSLICADCHHPETITCSSHFDAAQKFYDRGWRYYQSDAHCKHCSQKFQEVQAPV